MINSTTEEYAREPCVEYEEAIVYDEVEELEEVVEEVAESRYARNAEDDPRLALDD